MRSIETTGKTVEEAVQAGLRQLGLELSDVTIEVVSEGSKGFFGLFGSKPARVRITERDQLPEIDMDQILRPGASTRVSTIADKPQAPRAARPAKPAEPKPERPARAEAKPEPKPERPARAEGKSEPKAERPARAEGRPEPKPERPARAEGRTEPKPERPARAEAKPEPKPERPARTEARPEPRPEREPRPAKPRPPRPPKPEPRPEEPQCPALPEGPLPDQDPATLSELGRRAYEYLDKLTRLMGVPVKIYVAENDVGMSISMMGDTLGILIGRRGDTLDALQYLTSLEVNKDRDDYLRVSLDTEHYRAKREESLTRLAERMAARAVKTGRKVVLEPMNPYERRVLHSSLQNHPYVQTHSEGDEPNRRVVITLKSDAPQPEAGEPARKPARRSGERRDKAPREARHVEPHEGQEPREPRKPRGPKPPRPPRPAHEPAPEAPVALAHDVPSDPTDDTI